MKKERLRAVIDDAVLDLDKFIAFFRAVKGGQTISFPKKSLYFDNEQFSQGLKIGEAKLEDGNFIICSFSVNRDLTERSGKKAQYEIAKNVLKQEQSDAGIFIFYDSSGSFRFSLIYTNYLGRKRDWSTFRRFTYFVSKERTNKTFLNQIGEADFSSLSKIKEAFSVEPVTRQFYNELQSWYFWAMDKIKFPDDYKHSSDPAKDKEIRNATNLIRLITRIIFIWFLVEKGLVPPYLFAKEKLARVVKDFMKASNFYNAVLQNLFFGTLNQKMDERKFADESGYSANNEEEDGVKNLYRYADKFLISKNEVLELFKHIPFLNSGLFDCLDKKDESGKVVYVDGFSRNPNKQAVIPDYLFFQHDEERVNLSSYGLDVRRPVRGLIEILKSYNFTIDENTPVDQEIALDPELLGKVFENLLASYNPETATTARKSTGSYYTPREIVDYMVRESLVAYLKNTINDPDRLRQLLSYSEEIPAFSEQDRQKIISAIDNVKILDPACGSGAFLMGILHKLVYALQRIDPENKYWHELQYKKALKESEEVFKHEDKAERQERLNEINDAFDEGVNYSDYARKLYLIENCIYGVDIQPIAIQISKLRFFISLVLDQKIDKTKENFGIRALPNLETKFVVANTLIGLEISTNDLKILLKKNKTDIDIKLAEKIAYFDPYDQNAHADWFDPEWTFGVKDGFDIVIGNPPYGNLLKSNEKKLLKNKYLFSTLSDISSLFVEKGVDLLKNHGNLIFIITYAITFSKDFSKIRHLISNKFEESHIFTFDRDRCRIFESMSQTVSILKCFNKNSSNIRGIFTSRMFRETPDINKIEVTNCNRYLLPPKSGYNQIHRLPKIGEEINRQILEKMLQFNDSVRSVIKNGGYKIWIRKSGNYWYNAFDIKPYNSVEISPLHLEKDYSDFITLLINSSLFYFWFRIYGDGRHMNLDILENFPIPNKEKILKYKALLQKIKERFMNQLFSVFDKDGKRFLTSKIKHEIDLLDLVIGRYLYSFEYNEIYHILNYDFEIRGGNKLGKTFSNIIDKILTE